MYENSGPSDKAQKIAQAVMDAGFKAPQSAANLARSYRDTGKYTEAIAMADRAMRDDASGQSNTNLSSILLVKANSYDAMFLGKATNPIPLRHEILDLAYRAISNYASAYGAGDRYIGTGEISLRLTAIVSNLFEIGVPATEVQSMIPNTLSGLVKVPSTGSSCGDTLQARIKQYFEAAHAVSQLPANQIEAAINGLAQRIVAKNTAEEMTTVRDTLSGAADHYTEDQPAFADVLRKLGNRLAN